MLKFFHRHKIFRAGLIAALPHLSRVAPPSLALLFLPHLCQLPQSSLPVILSDLHSTNGGNLQPQLDIMQNSCCWCRCRLILPPNPTVKNISLHVYPLCLSQLLPLLSAQLLTVPFHGYWSSSDIEGCDSSSLRSSVDLMPPVYPVEASAWWSLTYLKDVSLSFSLRSDIAGGIRERVRGSACISHKGS